MLKLGLACLTVVIGLSSFAHAAGEGIEIDIWDDAAKAMIEKSKPTRATEPLHSKLLGETITFTYDVFDYDTNWKCYSRIGHPAPRHSFGRRLMNTEEPPMQWCGFKKGINPSAAHRGTPEAVDFKLHPQMLDRLVENASEVEVRTEKVSGHFGAKDVKFKILQLAGWECRVLDPSTSLPYGAKIDAKSCAYTPAPNETATVQAARSGGVVR